MHKLRQFALPLLIFLVACLVAALLWSGLLPDPIVLLRIDAGNLVFFAGIFLSIAWIYARLWASEKLEEAVLQSQVQAADERRRFLGRLDHELKNPITAVLAGLANLSGAANDRLRREALDSVEAQALRLSRLASDLRKLAELESRPLENEPVDVAVLLQEAFELVQDRPEAAERKLSLTLPKAPWPLPHVRGDRDLLFLAVHNLLDNAVKFTAPGNTIEVRAFEDGAHLVIEVADTGPGIDEEDLAHVWEELYRGQNARRVPGSGLGLPLVRAILARHGGQALLRSRAGQGTVFTLRLPLISQ
jgi:two-component system OmpR family sensor kinase